jgi:hypothetical protein
MSPEQIVQLLLIIPAGLSLQFQQFFVQQAWQETGEDVSTLLQAPGRLLVTQLSNWISDIDRLPTILCLFTGASKAFSGYNFDRVTNRDCQMVFALFPTYTMYHSSPTDDVEHALKVRGEIGDLYLESESLKKEFTQRLRSLRFIVRSMTAEGNVDGFEIWSM